MALVAASSLEHFPPPRPPPCPAPHIAWQAGPGEPPLLFLTEETTARLQRNVAREADPWQAAWRMVRERADEGLGARPEPYGGSDFSDFVAAAHHQFKLAAEMAIRCRVSGERKYAAAARALLLAWASHRPMPGSSLTVTTDPKPGARWGNKPDVGIKFAVMSITVAHALAAAYPYLEEGDIETIEPWLRYLAARIIESHEDWLASDCYGHQHYNNHLALQNMGLAAIGFALRDEEMVHRVYSGEPGAYFDLVCGAILVPGKPADQFYHADPSRETRPGEIYDRYRIVTVREGKGQGINYSFLQLRALLLTAEMAFNNGIDLYGFEGPHGESLELAYRQLAPYLITGDPACYGSYHARDGINPVQIEMYEIVRRRFGPGADRVFSKALAAGNRVRDAAYALGYHALLLYGEPEGE